MKLVNFIDGKIFNLSIYYRMITSSYILKGGAMDV